MPACGLRRGSSRGPSAAQLHQLKLKTLARGQASRDGRQGASSGTASSGWLMRRRGEVGPTTSNQPPHGARGRRLLGPAALRTYPFASLLSQVRARWARGLLSAFWERGSPDLPACGLRRGSKGGTSTAHLHQHRPKTLARGQASRGGGHGASSGTASSGWLARRRRDQGGVPHEVPVTQAMTTKGARRAPARAVSSFPL